MIQSPKMEAIGLVLPVLLRIRPVVTVYAAYGTVVLMITAAVFHIVRGEISQIGINILFAALAALVVWGRKIIERGCCRRKKADKCW